MFRTCKREFERTTINAIWFLVCETNNYRNWYCSLKLELRHRTHRTHKTPLYYYCKLSPYAHSSVFVTLPCYKCIQLWCYSFPMHSSTFIMITYRHFRVLTFSMVPCVHWRSAHTPVLLQWPFCSCDCPGRGIPPLRTTPAELHPPGTSRLPPQRTSLQFSDALFVSLHPGFHCLLGLELCGCIPFRCGSRLFLSERWGQLVGLPWWGKLAWGDLASGPSWVACRSVTCT